MIPHPPAERKDNKPGSGHFRRREYDGSSRRSTKQDGSLEITEKKIDVGKKFVDDSKSEELNSSQRHIEGIRQFHEQR